MYYVVNLPDVVIQLLKNYLGQLQVNEYLSKGKQAAD